MSEPKFTPGPWHVAGAVGCRMVATTKNADVGVICDVWGKGERHEANAALIAAAPEMYKKLEWIFTQFDASPDEELVMLAWEIEEFLRKARGEK